MRIRFTLPTLLAAIALACADARHLVAQGTSSTAPAAPAAGPIYDTTQVARRPRVKNAVEVAPLVSAHYSATQGGMRVAASAELEVVVGVDGAPEQVRVLRASTPAFAEGIERIARAVRFEPALRDGVPVRCRVSLPIEFDPSGY
jgi:TonB family protein